MAFEPVVFGPRWPTLSAKQLKQMRGELTKIAAARRAATHCKNNHLIDGIRKNGRRFCKACDRESRDEATQARLRRLIALPDNPRHGTFKAARDGCPCSKCFVAKAAQREKERLAYVVQEV